MTESNVIFITGTGRSGTNIFKEILSQHSNVATLPFEYRFTVDPRGVFDFYNTYPSYWTPYWADAKIKDLESFLLSLAELKNDNNAALKNKDTSPAPYAGWELNKWIPGYEDLVNRLISSLADFNYHARWPGTQEGIKNNEMYFSKKASQLDLVKPLRKFLNACFSAICIAQNKNFLVEDNTHSLLFAESISKVIPNGKMIHMVRDPRDVLASLMSQRWAPNDLGQCISWYLEVMNNWFEQRSKIPNDFFQEIRFEDLVMDTSKTLESFGAFAGLNVQDSMLKTELSKNNIGRYKTQFTSTEIDLLNTSLKEMLTEYRYL